MSSMQKKILGLISARITARGFEALNCPQWANTGLIHISSPGKFGTLGKVSYDFQDGNFSLSIYKTVDGKAVGVPSQPGRLDYFSHYMKYEAEKEFEVFMKHLDETLSELDSSDSTPTNPMKLFLVRTLEYDEDGEPYYIGVLRAKDVKSAVRLTRQVLMEFADEMGAVMSIRVYPLIDVGVGEGVLETADPIYDDLPKKGKKK